MFAHTYHRFCCGRCAYTNLVCLMLAVAVQLLSRVRLFATLWTAARQASLSFTISSTLLRLMSIELVMPSISFSALPSSSCPQSFPASGSFPMSWLFVPGGQSIEASASASVLPMNIQDWFPLGLTGLISLQSKRLSGVFCSSTIQIHISDADNKNKSHGYLIMYIWQLLGYSKLYSHTYIPLNLYLHSPPLRMFLPSL